MLGGLNFLSLLIKKDPEKHKIWRCFCSTNVWEKLKVHRWEKNLYSSCMSSPLVKTHFKYWTVKFSPLSLSYTPYTHTHTHTHTLKHAHAQTHTHTHTPLNTHTHQHLCTRTNTFSTPPPILNFVQFCVKSWLKAAKLIKVVFLLYEWSSWVV